MKTILYEVWYTDVSKDVKYGGGVSCVNVMASNITEAIKMTLEDSEKSDKMGRSVHQVKEINGGRCILPKVAWA